MKKTTTKLLCGAVAAAMLCGSNVEVSAAYQATGMPGISGTVNSAGTQGDSAAAGPVLGMRDIFDAEYYAEKYPDLKAAFGDNAEALYQHFLRYGLKEGRVMNPIIDIAKYREQYADLDEAFGDNWDLYVWHFFTYGVEEHRDNGTDFDLSAYLAAYADLREAFGTDYAAVARHYAQFGIRENRQEGSRTFIQMREEVRRLSVAQNKAGADGSQSGAGTESGSQSGAGTGNGSQNNAGGTESGSQTGTGDVSGGDAGEDAGESTVTTKKITNADGSWYTEYYSADGELFRTEYYAADGTQESYTEWQYNEYGTTESRYTASGIPTYRCVYEDGEKSWETFFTADGQPDYAYSYDAQGEIDEKNTYDAEGNHEFTYVYRDGGLTLTMHFTADAWNDYCITYEDGRMSRKDLFAEDGTCKGYSYDEAERLFGEEHSDENGKKIYECGYDVLTGEKTEESYYSYTADGQLEKISDYTDGVLTDEFYYTADEQNDYTYHYEDGVKSTEVYFERENGRLVCERTYSLQGDVKQLYRELYYTEWEEEEVRSLEVRYDYDESGKLTGIGKAYFKENGDWDYAEFYDATGTRMIRKEIYDAEGSPLKVYEYDTDGYLRKVCVYATAGDEDYTYTTYEYYAEGTYKGCVSREAFYDTKEAYEYEYEYRYEYSEYPKDGYAFRIVRQRYNSPEAATPEGAWTRYDTTTELKEDATWYPMP